MPHLLTPDGRGPFCMWRAPEAHDSYVMGADTGGGKASHDWSSVVVWRLWEPHVVARYRAKIDAFDFAEVLMCLGEFYGGRDGLAFLVPEINNHGMATLAKLKELGYYNIYSRVTWDRVDSEWKPIVGWTTSKKSRPVLIDHMRVAMMDKKCIIPDPVIIDEASTFIIDDNGKEDHQPGSHDDTLFAAMLGLEGRFQMRQQVPERETPNQKPKDHDWVWDQVKNLEDENEFRRQVMYQGDAF